MGLNNYKLGDLIEQRREKFDGKELLPIRGVSREGFIKPKVEDADTSLYNVFYKYDFVFNPARMEINSIALNMEYEKAICSSLYEVFYVKRKDIVLPEYLNLFVKRNEFARLCEFIGWGSAREYCRVGNISEITITLPSIEIQKRFVSIYEAMVENQKSYEQGLEDIKLMCDALLDKLRKNQTLETLGEYIELSEEKNANLEFGIEQVKGVSINKTFIDTKADMTDVNLQPYYVVRPNYFAYVTVTSRNSEKISLALNESKDTYICSSSYIVFKCRNEKTLNPQYLRTILGRDEFNRYARFNSWGSARETFDWKAMCDVKIPIPDIQLQEAIGKLYTAYTTRKEINEQLKAQIKDICPILIKGSLEEARA